MYTVGIITISDKGAAGGARIKAAENKTDASQR